MSEEKKKTKTAILGELESIKSLLEDEGIEDDLLEDDQFGDESDDIPLLTDSHSGNDDEPPLLTEALHDVVDNFEAELDEPRYGDDSDDDDFDFDDEDDIPLLQPELQSETLSSSSKSSSLFALDDDIETDEDLVGRALRSTGSHPSLSDTQSFEFAVAEAVDSFFDDDLADTELTDADSTAAESTATKSINRESTEMEFDDPESDLDAYPDTFEDDLNDDGLLELESLEDLAEPITPANPTEHQPSLFEQSDSQPAKDIAPKASPEPTPAPKSVSDKSARSLSTQEPVPSLFTPTKASQPNSFSNSVLNNKTENPFLPKHIRDRLHTADRTLQHEIDDSTLRERKKALAASELTTSVTSALPTSPSIPLSPSENKEDRLVDQVLKSVMPKIETELRDRIRTLIREERQNQKD